MVTEAFLMVTLGTTANSTGSFEGAMLLLFAVATFLMGVSALFGRLADYCLSQMKAYYDKPQETEFLLAYRLWSDRQELLGRLSINVIILGWWVPIVYFIVWYTWQSFSRMIDYVRYHPRPR